MAVSLGNLQNIVANGYKLPLSRHRFFYFPVGSNPCTFIKALLPSIPNAASYDPASKKAVHIAFSSEGLKQLGVISEKELDEFSSDFLNGPNRKALRDPCPPGLEYWNGVPRSELHCLVSTWSIDEQIDDEHSDYLSRLAQSHGLIEKIVRTGSKTITGKLLRKSAMVHFGFRDAISKPEVDWKDEKAELINLRRVVVGHATRDNPSSPNPMSASEQGAVDFARDGSYLAFTLIEQDVATFNKYLEQEARKLLPANADKKSVGERIEWLAAKLMGRWRNGQPLARVPDLSSQPIAEEELNRFDYSDDPKGERCPVASHIRLANPRSQALDPGRGPMPVVIRRGMPFGDELVGTIDDGRSRGLIGLFFCADINLQFVKTVQWLNQSDFSPVFAGRQRDEDPINGNRVNELATREFRIPTSTGDIVLKDMPLFTRTLGTAFLFLPSMSALQRISEKKITP